MTPAPRVSRAARLLGYAGLLPQAAAAALAAVGRDRPGLHGEGQIAPILIAFVYGSLILSFLGGVWWGFAMRRSEGQAALAALAVVPSLVAGAIVAYAFAFTETFWTLVLLGAAIALTLLVDRRLAATGEAPRDWMALRTPLSLGLGGLTILTALLLLA